MRETDPCLSDETGDSMLKFFRFDHLKPELVRFSLPFCNLAHWIATNIPAGPERTVVLRKLLEAKDAAVRAVAIQD